MCYLSSGVLLHLCQFSTANAANQATQKRACTNTGTGVSVLALLQRSAHNATHRCQVYAEMARYLPVTGSASRVGGHDGGSAVTVPCSNLGECRCRRSALSPGHGQDIALYLGFGLSQGDKRLVAQLDLLA